MIRTAALLAFLTAILLAIGFLFAGILGMTIAFALAIIINFLSYWFSDRIVLGMYKAQLSEDKELNDMVEAIAREADLPKPRVYIVPSETPNAFATGRNKNHAAVAITQGLTSLTREEMAGVIGHEISHIKNNDILVQTVSATIAGAIAYLAQFGYWSLFSRDSRDAGTFIGLVLMVVFAPIAAFIVRMSISRRREYSADYMGAILTKKPLALASALRKINKMSEENPMRGSSATSHLWIVNPFRHDWFTGLFSTHPPLERRVAKLERMSASEVHRK